MLKLLQDWFDHLYWEEWSQFAVLSVHKHYALYIRGRNPLSTLGDGSLAVHNNTKFSTYENKHNKCSRTMGGSGGWWYLSPAKGCYKVYVHV